MTQFERALSFVIESSGVPMRFLFESPEGYVGGMNRWTGGYELKPTPERSDDAGFLAGRLWLSFLSTGDSMYYEWAIRVVDGIRQAVEGSLEAVAPGMDLYYGLCWGAAITKSAEWEDLARRATRALLVSNWSDLSGTFVIPLSSGPIIAMESASWMLPLAWASRWDADLMSYFTTQLDHMVELGFVRADGSCYQIAELDERHRLTQFVSYQGFGTSSTWARGQAWGMHSYLSGYEAAGEERHLEVARRMANWWVDHVPADRVPFYDFDDPAGDALPRDSCAAAMAANVFIRLAHLVPEMADPYLAAADATLVELCRNYLSSGGLLLHGNAGNIRPPSIFGAPVTRRSPRDEPEWSGLYFRFPQEEIMPYGNFYFVEALFRRTRGPEQAFGLWPT